MKPVILIFISIFISFCCGSDDGYKNHKNDNPPPTQLPPPSQQQWPQIVAILKTNCERCHSGAGFLTNEPQFLGAPASRIQNGTMPPPTSAEAGTFAAQKNIVLQYISARK